MRKNSLSKTNPFLKDPQQRERLITRSVITSCGVEGIKVNLTDLSKPSPIIIHRRDKKIYQAKTNK